MRPRWLIEEEGPRPPLEPRAAQLLGALAVALNDRLMESVSSAANLSSAAVAALLWIERAPGVRTRELRKALGVGNAAMSELVARLEADGLVLRERDRRDRRASRLRVSEPGARLARQAVQARAHLTRSLVTRLPGVLLPRLIRVSEVLLSTLSERPRSALEGCRFCNWELCRGDPTAPCPVVIAAASHHGSSRPVERPSVSIHEDRRTIDGQDPPIELWLEPGGIAFRLDARRRLEVVCRGPERGRLDLERLREGHIALFAWNRATFTVLEAGRESFVQERALSLDMARGETPRQRVETLHGDFARRRETPPSRWL
ncbi:MAG: MarR family transcriptional regulator [Myxococcaceae bacterium]